MDRLSPLDPNESGRSVPLALDVDGEPVPTILGDGRVRGITTGAVPAGSHALRIMGVGSAVGIRALVVTPRPSHPVP